MMRCIVMTRVVWQFCSLFCISIHSPSALRLSCIRSLTWYGDSIAARGVACTCVRRRKRANIQGIVYPCDPLFVHTMLLLLLLLLLSYLREMRKHVTSHVMHWNSEIQTSPQYIFTYFLTHMMCATLICLHCPGAPRINYIASQCCVQGSLAA